jgi:hypothetical protein
MFWIGLGFAALRESGLWLPNHNPTDVWGPGAYGQFKTFLMMFSPGVAWGASIGALAKYTRRMI